MKRSQAILHPPHVNPVIDLLQSSLIERFTGTASTLVGFIESAANTGGHYVEN